MSERAESPLGTLARRVGFGKVKFPTSDVPRPSRRENPSTDDGEGETQASLTLAEAAHAPAPPRKRRSWIIPLGLALVVIVALTRFGYESWPTIKVWSEAQKLASRIGNSNRALAEQAAKRLTDLGPQGATVLLEALDSDVPMARAMACQYIPRLGLEPDVVVPAVARGLGDPEHSVRLAATREFRSVGELSTIARRDETLRETVLSSLVVNLTDDDSALKIATADAVAGFGNNAVSAVESLAPLLRDKRWDVRMAGACALVRIVGPEHTEAGKVLMASLAQPEARPEAAVDPAALANALHEAAPEVRDASMASLVTAIQSDDPSVRTFAIKTFEALKEDAKGSVPALEALIRKLGTMAGKSVVSTMDASGAIQDQDEALATRADVARTLVTIEGKASTVGISALLDAIAEPTVGRERRWAAFELVRKTDLPALKLVVPALLEQGQSPIPSSLTAHDSIEILKLIDPRALADSKKSSPGPGSTGSFEDQTP
jgi:hypothetical protein